MLTFTIIASALVLLCLWQNALTQIDMDYNYGYSFPTIIVDYILFGAIWIIAFVINFWILRMLDTNLSFASYTVAMAFGIICWYYIMHSYSKLNEISRTA